MLQPLPLFVLQRKRELERFILTNQATHNPVLPLNSSSDAHWYLYGVARTIAVKILVSFQVLSLSKCYGSRSE